MDAVVLFPVWAFIGISGLLSICLAIIGGLLIRVLSKVDGTLEKLDHQMSDHAIRIAVIESRAR